MRRILALTAVLLAAAIAVTVSGCSVVSTAAPSDPGPSLSADPEPSPSQALPSAEPPATPSEQASPDPSSSVTPTPAAPASSSALTPSAEPGPVVIDEQDYLAFGDALMQSDGIGPVKFNMAEDELVAELGEPDSKSAFEIWGADGLEHAYWSYPASGLEINMTKHPDEEKSIVYAIRASLPCTLATQRGIKLGDTKEAVLSAYAEAIDPDENLDTESRVLIGSVYGGIVVEIEEGLVKSIFIGASAE